MAFGGNNFDVFHPDASQLAGNVVGGFLNVGLVFIEGAYAGDAKQIFKFIEKSLLITAGEINGRRSHSSSFLVEGAGVLRIDVLGNVTVYRDGIVDAGRQQECAAS
jgi:hypothetical protein